MAKSIIGSVGVGGANRRGDVITIQDLLNGVPETKGGPAQKLERDGKSGPLTCGAISRFQSKTLGFQDGRVDPNGHTLFKLNQLSLGALNSPGTSGGTGPVAPQIPGAGTGLPTDAGLPRPPGSPPAGISAIRHRIIEIAAGEATPPPGKVSELVRERDPENGRTVRAGWRRLKQFFDEAVEGWTENHWEIKGYLDGVQLPGQRVRSPVPAASAGVASSPHGAPSKLAFPA